MDLKWFLDSCRYLQWTRWRNIGRKSSAKINSYKTKWRNVLINFSRQNCWDLSLLLEPVLHRGKTVKRDEKLNRYEAELLSTNNEITFSRWQEYETSFSFKQLSLSWNDLGWKNWNGEKNAVDCSEILAFYKKIHGQC